MSTAFLTSIDLTKNELLNAVVQNVTPAPSNPREGQIYFDTSTHLFGYFDGSGWIYPGESVGGGVSSVSVNSANGFSGTVANASTTPAITISTTVTGLLKGNGTAVSAATSGTDYAPATSGTSILKGSGSGGFNNAVSGTDYAPATSGTGILKGNGSGGFNAATANTDYAPPANPTFTGTVTVPTPSVSTAAANKGYVDTVAQGLNTKPSVLALATSNITLTGAQTIDGVAVVAGNRVLAVAQSTASQNGIWTVASGAWTRPADFASASTQQGDYVFVEEGTAGVGQGWVLTGTAVTVDTSAQTWTQFTGAGEITAGAGLAKSGNTLSVENGGVLTVAHGGTGAATVSAAKGTLGFGSIFNSPAKGDGTSTTFAIVHNLNNAHPLVQVYSTAAGGQVICDVTPTNANTVTLTFGSAPATGDIFCVVVG